MATAPVTDSIETMPDKGVTIDPNDFTPLAQFGASFWLDEFQPLRSGQALSSKVRCQFRDTLITDVDTLVVEACLDFGCSRKTQAILTMRTGGSVDGLTVLRGVWTGYMASLKATMDGGRNKRAHIGTDPKIMDLVVKEAKALKAKLTPCDEVYGSDGTYLEQVSFRYDPATRTLTANPSFGS